MNCTTIDAHVFFKHSPEEVEALQAATIPLAEQIQAVSRGAGRGMIRTVLDGNYFRVGDAAAMRVMLLRAAKYARAHLDDYFPMMHEGIVRNAEVLEEAVNAYWQNFQYHCEELIPTK